MSTFEPCSSPCWCLVKIYSLQALEGYNVQGLIEDSALCPKGSFTPVSCSEIGHPESRVCFLEASSLNVKSITYAEFL